MAIKTAKMCIITHNGGLVYCCIEACKELQLWLKKFLHELGLMQETYNLYCDSQSVIHLCKNSSFHSISKHIDVRYHWLRDVLEEKQMHIEKVHTYENDFDMMTKCLLI